MLTMEVSTLMSVKTIEAFEEENLDADSPLAQLIELGQDQGFVSIDNVLQMIPGEQRQAEKLEEIFEILLNAGIPIMDEDEGELPVAKAKEAVEEEEDEERGYAYERPEDPLAEAEVNDLVRLYFNEAAIVPLLTSEEEVTLAKAMEAGQKAREQLAEPGLNAAEREELMQTVQEGWDARQHLIVANSRLVISIAKKNMNRGLPLIDLIQEGNIGLVAPRAA